MNLVTIKIGDDDVKILEGIFSNKFEPTCHEDRIIAEILRQVVEHPKMKVPNRKNPNKYIP